MAGLSHCYLGFQIHVLPHVGPVLVPLHAEAVGGLAKEFTALGEDPVQSEFEGVVEHSRDDLGEPGAAEFEARVGVDLDDPEVLAFVDHEIEAEYLELLCFGRSAPLLALEHLGEPCLHGHPHLPPHLLHQLLPLQPHLPPQVAQRQDVALLELPIRLAVLLDGVVGEVRVVAAVGQVKQHARSPDVALPKKVHLLALSHHRIHSDVELPPLYQQRLLDVLLHDETRLLISRQLSPQQVAQVLHPPEQMDPSPPVHVRWLQDPQPALPVDLQLDGSHERALLFESRHIDEGVVGLELEDEGAMDLLDLLAANVVGDGGWRFLLVGSKVLTMLERAVLFGDLFGGIEHVVRFLLRGVGGLVVGARPFAPIQTRTVEIDELLDLVLADFWIAEVELEACRDFPEHLDLLLQTVRSQVPRQSHLVRNCLVHGQVVEQLALD